MKIPKKRFLYLPTEPELKDLMSQMHGKYDAFKTCSLRLMDDFHQYNYRLSLCSNKSYSYEEQQAAGCLPNDTTQQCSDKLLKVCIRQPALALKDSSAKVQSTLQALITKSTEFTNRLRALSDQLSDQLQERH